MTFDKIRGQKINLATFNDDDIIKGRKLPIGTIRKWGGAGWFIKVADVHGDWNASWKPYNNPTEKNQVKEEHGHISEIANAIADHSGPGTVPNPDTKGPGGVINKVVLDDQSPLEKIDTFWSMGIKDEDKLLTLSGAAPDEGLRRIEELSLGAPLFTDAEYEKVNTEIDEMEAQRRLIRADAESVHARWDTYDELLETLVSGAYGQSMKSVVAWGTGGVGKTFGVEQNFGKFVVHRDTGEIAFKDTLIAEGKEWDSADPTLHPENEWRELRRFDPEIHRAGGPDYEWAKFSGAISAVEFYKSMYMHNGKIISFDDMDSVLLDPQIIGMLKSAIDTKQEDVMWKKRGKLEEHDLESMVDIPKSFKFKGKVIFVTNLSTDQMMDPKLNPITQSRTDGIDLSMTRDETIDRIDMIKDYMVFEDDQGNPINVTSGEKEEVIGFLRLFKNYIPIGYFNARKFGHIVIALKNSQKNPGRNWKNTAFNKLSLGSPATKALVLKELRKERGDKRIESEFDKEIANL